MCRVLLGCDKVGWCGVRFQGLWSSVAPPKNTKQFKSPLRPCSLINAQDMNRAFVCRSVELQPLARQLDEWFVQASCAGVHIFGKPHVCRKPKMECAGNGGREGRKMESKQAKPFCASSSMFASTYNAIA